MRLDVITVCHCIPYSEALKYASQNAIISPMKKRATKKKNTTIAYIDGKINVLEANVRECNAQINHLKGLIK